MEAEPLDKVADFEVKCLLENLLKSRIHHYFLRKLLNPQSTEKLTIELNYPEVIITTENHEKTNPSMLAESSLPSKL